ncbi:MAG: biotin transporter BioY [Candidatus Zixiibacteriota bacterium]
MNVAENIRRPVIVDRLHSLRGVSSSLAREALLLVSFNLLLIASAQVSIPLPGELVPITGQTFGVLLCALALGRLRATGVVIIYLAEGAAGLPVFALGAAGPAVLIGPTGGYLVGFLVCALVVGFLADRGWDRSYIKSFLAMILGTTLIFICGLAWLSRFVDGSVLLIQGLYPFLPGAVMKIAAAFWLLPKVADLSRR